MQSQGSGSKREYKVEVEVYVWADDAGHALRVAEDVMRYCRRRSVVSRTVIGLAHRTGGVADAT